MKKGAYDLGRKAVYYIVVIVIIAILFVFISSSFRKYQIEKLSILNEVTDFIIVNNVIKCISYKDADTGRFYLYRIDESKFDKDSMVKCLGPEKLYSSKAIRLKIIGGKEFETQKPYYDFVRYEKTVEFTGSKGEKTEKTLEIYIEKYPVIT